MRTGLLLLSTFFIYLFAGLSRAAADAGCTNCTVNGTDSDNATNETTTPEPIMYERVLYRLYFPHPSCVDVATPRPEPINVSLPLNESSYTLQEVMEAATDQDESYQFSLLYINEDLGYLLEGVNGTDVDGNCQWKIYYQAPDETKPTQLVNLPTYETLIRIEEVDTIEPNATLVLCYQDISPPTSEPVEQTTFIIQPTTTTMATTSITEPSSSSTPSTPVVSPPIITTSRQSSSEMLPTMPIGGPRGGTSTINYSETNIFLILSITLCFYVIF